MKKLVWILLLIFCLAPQASAMELTAPQVPEAAAERMPENTESFGEGLWELVRSALAKLRPDLREGCQVSLSVIAAVLLASLLRTFPGSVQVIANLAGTVVIAVTLMLSTNSMIRLGTQTVQQLSDYGKLLYPVMTSALAAQGGITTSAALYAGTALFDAVLSSLISGLLIPMVYLFLALAAANSAVGEDLLKKMRDLIKTVVSWCLKTLLTVFTTYMSITGVVSGSTDAAALKAAKVTISSVVPVVGSILSDASEAVLISAGVMKSAAGVYGILAILALFLEPFLRIGIHYLMLKATAALCAVFGSGGGAGLIEDFSTAMGLLLAMTGATCLLLLISTVCFLKGVG